MLNNILSESRAEIAYCILFYFSPPCEAINIHGSVDKRVVSCPYARSEWSSADPLQLPVSSVSSKPTADEDDGVSRKRATHWMANQPEGKTAQCLEGCRTFQAVILKVIIEDLCKPFIHCIWTQWRRISLKQGLGNCSKILKWIPINVTVMKSWHN